MKTADDSTILQDMAVARKTAAKRQGKNMASSSSSCDDNSHETGGVRAMAYDYDHPAAPQVSSLSRANTSSSGGDDEYRASGSHSDDTETTSSMSSAASQSDDLDSASSPCLEDLRRLYEAMTVTADSADATPHCHLHHHIVGWNGHDWVRDCRPASAQQQQQQQQQQQRLPLRRLPKYLDSPEPDALSTHALPTNFGIVVPGVYRSSYPTAHDLPFIHDLNLKTIVTLVDKDIPANYATFITSEGIRHHVVPTKGTKKTDIPVAVMQSILRLVLDQQNHPLLIHCNQGRHRTGCVVAVVRKFNGWELQNIVDEYRAFAEPKVRDCDLRYITHFELSALSKEPAGRLTTDWDAGSVFRFRVRSFLLFTLLSLVALCVWLLSGRRMSAYMWTSRA